MKNSRLLVHLSSQLLRSRQLALRGLSSIQEPSSSFRLPRPPTRDPHDAPPAFSPQQRPQNQRRQSQNGKATKQRNKKSRTTFEKHVPPGSILAEHLQAAGDTIIPKSCWVSIEGISPVVSLDYIISSIQTALDQEAAKGIVDLDAPWNQIQDESVPFCSFSANNHRNNNMEWVEQARVNLSLFARPTSWLIKFQNRSIVHALLTHARENSIFSPMRAMVKEYRQGRQNGEQGTGVLHQHYDVSDATLRVEGCAPNTRDMFILNMFSRYDLREASKGPPVEEWKPRVVRADQKDVYVPKIFLVHFEDASWARAALRERQSYRQKIGNEWGNELTLAQYPKQRI